MHWPSRRFQAARDEDTSGGAGGTPGSGSFSAPPPSDVNVAEAPVATHRFSPPPPANDPASAGRAVPGASYEAMDYSKYSSSVYESDGLRDAQLSRKEAGMYDGYWIQNPRARQCVNNIQLGAKLGASVGGCFGMITGLWVAVSQRNVLVLPVSVVGGAVSFGFFLGCGMIIRCEEGPAHLPPACASPEAQAPSLPASGAAASAAPRVAGAALRRWPRTAGLWPLAHVDLSE